MAKASVFDISKKVFSLILYVAASLACFFDSQGEYGYLELTYTGILAFLIIDCFNKGEPIIVGHHIAASMIISEPFFIEHKKEHIIFVVNMLLVGELSSVFLTIRRLVECFPNKKERYRSLLNISDACFLASFLYFRSYNIAIHILDPYFYSILTIGNLAPIRSAAIIFLILLNYYWTYEVLKVAHGKLFLTRH